MSNLLKTIWNKFLTVFGDIKISKYPFWLIYDPEYFKMSGDKILEVLKHVRVGDVILRGYDGYIDSYFIPKTLKHGRYSHAGIVSAFNEVIHAVAPAVQKTNLVEFMECDRIAIFRPKKCVTEPMLRAEEYAKMGVPYDFDFQKGDESLYCFELCAECYRNLEIPRRDVSIMLGLIKRKQCFLAQSFFDSNDFNLVFEYNPKHQIDYHSVIW